MTNTDEIYQKLLVAIRETMEDVEIESAQSLKGKNILENIGMDSLDVIKFALTIEEELGQRIPDDDWDDKDLMDIDKLVSYLQAHA